MLISQLEAKIDAKTKQMHQLEDQILEINKSIANLTEYRDKLLDQILEINKSIANLTEYRDKLLEQKSDIWWQIEDTKEDIALLKEVYHL